MVAKEIVCGNEIIFSQICQGNELRKLKKSMLGGLKAILRIAYNNEKKTKGKHERCIT